MERSVAVKKLGRLLGKKLGYRVNDKAPSREERAAAQATISAAVADREKIKVQLDARRRAVLEGDSEYKSLQAAHTAARERADTLFSITSHFKITVGVSNSMFFHVKAEGDSWEDVIDKLEAEERKAAA